MDEKEVNLAIIGLGYWGPNFARLCFEAENINLMYCCDINKKSLQKIKKQFPSVIAVNDYREILKDKRVDGVIVVTPPETHWKICRNILLAGKDVLVEKPLTLKTKDALDLVKISKKKKRILMVDHIYKYNSAITKLADIIKKNKLGEIFYLAASYTALGPVRNDVNALLDLAPHHFYTLNYILKKNPVWISAVGESYLKEGNSDVAFITIAYPGNILAKVHVSWLYPFKVRDIVVIGKEKMAMFDDMSSGEKLKIYDKSAFFDSTHPEYPAILKIIYREGDIVAPRLEPKEPLKEVLLQFKKSILTRRKPISSGEDGALVVKMLVAAQKSLKKEGKRIFL